MQNPIFFGLLNQFDPASIAGLQLWLAADRIAGLVDGDPVGTWSDLSGNGHNATQATGSLKPLYKTGVLNGKPVVRFDGVDDELDFTGFMTGIAAAEAFIVVKITSDPPVAGTSSGLWSFGSDGNNTHFPYTDGVIYDVFGTSSRKTTVNPTPSLTSGNIYGVVTSSAQWTSRLNGSQLFTTATNTVGWAGSPTIGKSLDAVYLSGDIAEFVIYNSVLSTSQRAQVNGYLGSKYNIAVS